MQSALGHGSPAVKAGRLRFVLVAGSGLAAVAAANLAPLSAAASTGTGVGASPIILVQPARPGHSYTLPSLYLVNTGTVTSRYLVRAARLQNGPQHDVPTSWVGVPATPLSLRPKASANVPLTLNVPANAAAGNYMTDIVAGTAAAGRTGGASLGAQAATQLRFTVANGSGGGFPGWAVFALLGAAVAAGVVWFVRRSGFRLHVERRP